LVQNVLDPRAHAGQIGLQFEPAPVLPHAIGQLSVPLEQAAQQLVGFREMISGQKYLPQTRVYVLFLP
jgi:hypothetical protein